MSQFRGRRHYACRAGACRAGACRAGRAAGLRRGALAALLCFAAATVHGLQVGPEGHDREQPIHWRADHAEVDTTGRTILTGNVRMEQGAMLVEADRMVIEYDGDQVVRVTAEGSPARYRQRPGSGAEAVGADARRMVYHALEERVELTGRAHLTQERNEFRGETIHYDLREGRIDAEGDGGGSVEMIWQPERAAERAAPLR